MVHLHHPSFGAYLPFYEIPFSSWIIQYCLTESEHVRTLVHRFANNYTNRLPVFPIVQAKNPQRSPTTPAFFNLHTRKNILRDWFSYLPNDVLVWTIRTIPLHKLIIISIYLNFLYYAINLPVHKALFENFFFNSLKTPESYKKFAAISWKAYHIYVWKTSGFVFFPSPNRFFNSFNVCIFF